MKEKLKLITSTLAISCFVFFAIATGDSKTETKQTDYSNTDAYKDGKAAGETAKLLGGSSYCSGEMAQEQGACIDQVSKDAWCEGYNAGYNGK